MKIFLIILIILIILILSLFFYNFFNDFIFEQIKGTNGYYLNKDELYEYLIKDNDNYFKNFSTTDMKVRNVNNIEEYYQKIRESCYNIDKDSESFLNKCITIANSKLNNYKCIGFDGAKCANIQWNIGIIKDNLYEEGYPHTRYNVIIIPLKSLNNMNSLINTLIHEKIHVYQKMYPKDIEQYLQANGYTKYKMRNTFNNTRSNPDMDEWIYKNKDNQIMIAEYNENASSIMDVNIKPNNSSKYEHPFEYMAYDITKLIE
jgi:hypothetical protein